MNYNNIARTNYFEVFSFEKFKKEIDDLNVSAKIVEGEGKVCLLFEDGLPSEKQNEETGEYSDICWVQIIFPHLKKGEVCVITESWSEGMRYMGGSSTAIGWGGIGWGGDVIYMDTNEIYERAREHFGESASLTKAEY